jgi:hypothetical protein
MNATVIIEQLAEIIARQAEIIRELHGLLAQHTAAAALESKLEALQRDTDSIQ